MCIVYLYVYIYIYICICVYVYIYIYIYTCMYGVLPKDGILPHLPRLGLRGALLRRVPG